MSRRTTQEILTELRYHATWTLHRQGDPGCAARVRARWLLTFLDDYERRLGGDKPFELEVQIDE